MVQRVDLNISATHTITKNLIEEITLLIARYQILFDQPDMPRAVENNLNQALNEATMYLEALDDYQVERSS